MSGGLFLVLITPIRRLLRTVFLSLDYSASVTPISGIGKTEPPKDGTSAMGRRLALSSTE
jgi:hypothetical protein